MGVRVPWKRSSHLAGTGAVLPKSGFMVRWSSPPAMHHFSLLGGIRNLALEPANRSGPRQMDRQKRPSYATMSPVNAPEPVAAPAPFAANAPFLAIRRHRLPFSATRQLLAVHPRLP